MKISVMSLFRDSEQYIDRTLKQFESMNSIENVEFEYFFYENDSKDNTRELLNSWCDNNNGKLLYEDKGYPKFGSINHLERFILLAYYRNTLKRFLVDNTDSDYTIIVDSDIVFNNKCIEQLIEYKDYNDCAMMTGNSRCAIRSEIFSKCMNSYYDTAPFRDSLGGSGLLWADCPSRLEKDLELWKKGNPIRVQSAFGSIAILKTKYLKEVYWSSHGEGVEHMEFCYRLHEFGHIYGLPSAKCYITDAIVPENNKQATRIKQTQDKNILKQYENIISNNP